MTQQQTGPHRTAKMPAMETDPNDGVVDRRPIAARQLRPVILVAEWLVRRRASPNGISIIGMICALLAGCSFAVAPAHPWMWLLGAALVQARLMANLLDGMVAIGRAIASPVGELFNEVPDRVSDTAVLAGVGLAAGIPWLGVAAALAAMATAYIRVLGKASGRPSDFSGPMAKQHRMAVITALSLWCTFAPAAYTARAPMAALVLILILATFTAGRRLLRLARAMRAA
jgi:phosphatidylglycerophosphate synthase